MPLVDEISAIAQSKATEGEKRQRIYALKVSALLDVISGLIGRPFQHNGLLICINSAHATDQPALALDVTFTRPPAAPVTHQITITNPPLLPRNRTGNEREDLKAALAEMLEGFV